MTTHLMQNYIGCWDHVRITPGKLPNPELNCNYFVCNFESNPAIIIMFQEFYQVFFMKV